MTQTHDVEAGPFPFGPAMASTVALPPPPAPTGASEPVVMVTVDPAVPHGPLFDVRATTLRVVVPPGPLRYLLDELPGPPGRLVDDLAAEPWCVAAEMFEAVPAEPGGLPPSGFAALDVVVWDPALGRLRYRLLVQRPLRRRTPTEPALTSLQKLRARVRATSPLQIPTLVNTSPNVQPAPGTPSAWEEDPWRDVHPAVVLLGIAVAVLGPILLAMALAV